MNIKQKIFDLRKQVNKLNEEFEKLTKEVKTENNQDINQMNMEYKNLLGWLTVERINNIYYLKIESPNIDYNILYNKKFEVIEVETNIDLGYSFGVNNRKTSSLKLKEIDTIQEILNNSVIKYDTLQTLDWLKGTLTYENTTHAKIIDAINDVLKVHDFNKFKE
jgi:hypothetical protein